MFSRLSSILALEIESQESDTDLAFPESGIKPGTTASLGCSYAWRIATSWQTALRKLFLTYKYVKTS